MRDPSLERLRSHVPGGQKGRGRMRGGVLLLGLSPAGSRRPEALLVFIVGRSGGRPGGGRILWQGSRWGGLRSSSPSLNLMPEGVQARHGACAGCEEVCPIQKDGGEQGRCAPMAQVRG